MNCNTINPCQCDEHLIFNIDLRTEQPVRLNKIAQEIVPLGDKIGEHHISVNLVYRQNDETKHINLPAYVTETPQERILNILFPADTKVSVKQAEQTTEVNRLEYHIDRLTEVVTEITGTTETATESVFNFVTIDLNLMTEEEGINTPALQDSVYQQGIKFTDIEKPFLFKITKTIGTTRAVCYFYNKTMSLTKRGFVSFTINIDIRNSDIVKAIGSGRIYFHGKQIANGTYEARLEDSHYGIPGTEAIFLCENSDGLLSLLDRGMGLDLGVPGVSWENFLAALVEKRFPAVYLKSMDSEIFCPVSYQFTPNTTIPSNFDGKMVISYFKTVGEGTELWRETRTFTNTSLLLSGATFDFEIKKFTLGAAIN